MRRPINFEPAIAVCFETTSLTMTRKYSHSIVTSPSSHRKNQKNEIELLLLQQERNVKIENHDLHHQLQQEVETALQKKNGDYDERSKE